MPIVRVKDKYQVTIPADIREDIDVEVGDFLEVKTEKGKITLEPKTAIDKELALALEDVRHGRVSPSFASTEEAVRYLKKQVRQHKNAR